ncbi:MAG: hypothetical protein IT497_06755 [Ottowia sp.]|nr:hypothetical protein [Ottowia sp.]
MTFSTLIAASQSACQTWLESCETSFAQYFKPSIDGSMLFEEEMTTFWNIGSNFWNSSGYLASKLLENSYGVFA